MSISICIYEDNGFHDLLPLTYTRPVYDLVTGISSLRSKIRRGFPDSPLQLHCRSYLAPLVAEKNPEVTVNSPTGDICLFINGRFIFNNIAQLQDHNNQECAFVNGGRLAAFRLKAENYSGIDWSRPVTLATEELPDLPKVEVDGSFISYPWDLVNKNEQQIEDEFRILAQPKQHNPKNDEQVVMLQPSAIHVGSNSRLMPGTVLDAENGPVFIDDNVRVMPNSYIQGPVYIGKNSLVKPCSKIFRGTSIGEVCKVGGEIEDSIIYSFSNKQHDGFLGHAYIGEWVNIGAGTTNSDLKNNYSSVKVPINGRLVDSKQQFVGLFMADHAKAGINTMINTGTVIGAMSVVFGDGFPPKDIPSYCWGGKDGLVEHDLQKALDTAANVMARRNRKLSAVEKTLYESIFQMTGDERQSKLS